MHAHRKYHDEAERRLWQNPEAILSDAGLKPGMTFIDVGCGDGFFAIPAARAVGSHGHVHGVDADEISINELSQKAAKEGLTNLQARAGAAEDIILCDGCADVVFFGICLHDFEDPARVLRNSRHMLKKGGRLVDVDWKKEPMDMGPPLEKRFDEAKATKLMVESGFTVDSIKNVGRYHYMVIAK
ncbi:MAG TPA: methyltransferase domain-containing protein [Methanocellaceae archaeon]